MLNLGIIIYSEDSLMWDYMVLQLKLACYNPFLCNSFSGLETKAPFTLTIQGGSTGPIHCLSVLYKRYQGGVGGLCKPSFKLPREVVSD